MGKNKRQRFSSHSKPAKDEGMGKRARLTAVSKTSQPSKTKKKHIQLQHTKPTIPFLPHNQILLIGEGDLSFSRSLVESYCCRSVTATVFEPQKELEAKYPHVTENITAIEAAGGTVRYGVDAVKSGPLWRDVRGKMDRVFFNFPHVGGKSTDVNRQVRYNQELLVGFFKNALASLAPRGSIVVTLFEGMPYTLWNIRDLGRHSGLQVETSFKFQARAYPGYRHARTLGVIKGKDGKERGGWKGEERESRSFVFVRKGDVIEGLQGPSVKRKRADSSDSEDEAFIEEEAANWDGDEQGEKEAGVEENWDGVSDSDSDSDDQRKPEINEDE